MNSSRPRGTGEHIKLRVKTLGVTNVKAYKDLGAPNGARLASEAVQTRLSMRKRQFFTKFVSYGCIRGHSARLVNVFPLICAWCKGHAQDASLLAETRALGTIEVELDRKSLVSRRLQPSGEGSVNRRCRTMAIRYLSSVAPSQPNETPLRHYASTETVLERLKLSLMSRPCWSCWFCTK